jgi:ATP/maltotriose-dependent transcriptional regulator MalT
MASQTQNLVGRAEEMALFDRALDELDRGTSAAAVEIVGEPGIGKTRLLAELAAHADTRGQLVLAGSASELERDLPFSVFVDALDEYLRAFDPARMAELDDDVRTELAHVFPSLTSLATEHEVALQHERYRSHRAVRALLELLAARQPLVLVLDDLHWADAASVELVGALLRRPPARPVLLALAVRPRQVPERLAAAFERARRAEVLVRVELGALSAEEARVLLGGTVAGREADVLYEESGGNPFYLEQLARSAGRTGGPADTRDETSLESIGVPASVAAALAEELGLLSDAARRVLEGAAVAGDPFEPELAAAAADLPDAAVIDAVDELLGVDLVRPTDVPRRFRFRHPLVRRAVYGATAAGWRLGAHERCAAMLAARGASAAERAHHVERSAREGDVEAAALLRDAGEQSVRLAPGSAANWFAEALRLLPQASTQERVELLFEQSGALTAAGRYSDSHAALLDALATAPDDDPLLFARLARACAAVEGLLGLQEEAAARLSAAADRLPDLRSPEQVALLIDLAVSYLWLARYEEILVSAERAVAAARKLDDPPFTAAALAARSLGHSATGAPELAEADRSASAAVVDSLPDSEIARHIQSAALLGGMELYLDHYAEGDVHASRALALARSTGRGEHVLVLVQTLGALWRQRGKLVEAAELLDGGIEAARVLGNTHALIWGLSSRSSTALRVGDVELALATAQECVELSKNRAVSFHSAEASADLAAALVETGEPAQAVELLVERAGGEELTRIAASPRARYLDVLARARLALGDRAGARRSAECATGWAETVRLPMAAAWAGRAAAAVELDAGNAGLAAELALGSAEAAEGAGAPVEAALSRIVAGRALAAEGKSEHAATELQSAARELEARGALRYRDEAERELRRLGKTVYRRSAAGTGVAGLEALTERELQLAHLVVDRKTNPQIAAELFLSQKTVETHLRNIFRKLGVSSRVELARAVERAEHDGA